MIIAIDGPAGAGKGTLGRNLAKRLSFAYLDTGLLYRSVAWLAFRHHVPLDDVHGLVQLTLGLRSWGQEIHLNELKSPFIAEAASQIARYAELRESLNTYMRQFAKDPGDSFKGAILDGRDIGTAVCPQAELKFFITASVEERAKRRFQELQSMGVASSFEKVLEDVKARDERDQSRSQAPLRPADDSIIIDTTTLSLEEVLEQVLNHILRIFPDSVDSSS
jgi:cytidylate kinase